MTTVIDRGSLAMWDRLLTPDEGEPSAEHARYLLRLRFTPADDERMTVLSEKANEGTLTDMERVELDDYIYVGHLLTKLHSFARMALRRAADGG